MKYSAIVRLSLKKLRYSNILIKFCLLNRELKKHEVVRNHSYTRAALLWLALNPEDLSIKFYPDLNFLLLFGSSQNGSITEQKELSIKYLCQFSGLEKTKLFSNKMKFKHLSLY